LNKAFYLVLFLSDKSESSENSITARRATTACAARTFGKVEQTNNTSAGLQGVALILFKFCLISEAQPHSS
ncbi:hypothetical protein VJI99_11380, partial [Capnocytophaga ochracea]|nr:hypothetical protein [Capnocytophaga ochracea]